MKKYIRFAGFAFFMIILAGCRLQREVLIEGNTMGTTYHIKIVAGYFDRISDLKEKIDRRLQEVNDSMSIYKADSEISRFNAIQNTEERFAVSEDFFNVTKAAEKLYRLTNGAWDGTIKPLVDLWGFGSPSAQKKIPAKQHIDWLLIDVGFRHIEISDSRHIRKKKRSLSLDLNSIAKGYAVDRVAAVIKENGIENFLVEVGGEVYASGTKKNRQPWRIGINRPQKDASPSQVYRVVTLENLALATSGDYRNFFEIEGRRYSHVLDPRTGHPVRNSVVSASVMAQTCTFADGLATALMVLGPDKGIELVERLENVEAMIVVQQADGRLADYFSRGFNPVKVLP
ncbi:MAG: FAD:protein FMN transferase [Desulfobacterales bacterium]|nr:FAD:protein FMN transferase [Desulfobacterales bacterium]